MLVLTRKLGEQIVVPSLNLTVTIVAIENNKVRIGITAPAGVDVHREEVWQRICEQTLDCVHKD